MAESVSLMRHLTEAIPLDVYNRVFSMPAIPDGTTVYYDAAADFYGEPPPSRASEIAAEGVVRTPLLRLD